MTQLLAAMFFSGVLLIAIAAMVDIWRSNADLIRAAMPWSGRQIVPASHFEVKLVQRRRDPRPYWATPSSSSDLPSRAITVSPATVR